MTEQTITFTPAAELRKGFRCLAKGMLLIVRSIAKLINSSVYKCPWAYIVAILILSLAASFFSIAKARSERDATNKRNYQLQQKIEQLQMAKDAKTEVRYVCTD